MDFFCGEAKDVIELSKCGERCLPIYYYPRQILAMILESDKYVVIKVVLAPRNDAPRSVGDGVENQIIGYLLGEYQQKRNFHICSFGVDSTHRKKGIGKKLVEFTRKKVKKNSCKTMSLNVHIENTGAMEFYKKCGFKIIKIRKDYYQGPNGKGSVQNAKSQDAYYMKRKCSMNP